MMVILPIAIPAYVMSGIGGAIFSWDGAEIINYLIFAVSEKEYFQAKVSGAVLFGSLYAIWYHQKMWPFSLIFDELGGKKKVSRQNF